MATCPRCQAEATGNFCSSCGASLRPRPCPACGGSPEAGARFCNLCGHNLASTADPSSGGGSSAADPRLGWWVAGVFAVGLTLILAVPVLRSGGGATSTGLPAPSTAPVGAAPDISSLTPAEAALRLFERVMTAVDAGDVQTVQQFLPMAIAAHERARPLDLDQLFHLATLQQAGGNHVAALAVTDEALAVSQTHLLALMAAGASAGAMGDSVAARAYATRFLESYDAELAKRLIEYEQHSNQLEAHAAVARELAGG